jgi:hypothetical protein
VLMPEVTFRPVHGATTMFEILSAGESVGIVWLHSAVWFADKASMASPAVRGATREEAATKLLGS